MQDFIRFARQGEVTESPILAKVSLSIYDHAVYWDTFDKFDEQRLHLTAEEVLDELFKPDDPQRMLFILEWYQYLITDNKVEKNVYSG